MINFANTKDNMTDELQLPSFDSFCDEYYKYAPNDFVIIITHFKQLNIDMTELISIINNYIYNNLEGGFNMFNFITDILNILEIQITYTMTDVHNYIINNLNVPGNDISLIASTTESIYGIVAIWSLLQQ